jgi:hypothetical protein
MSIEQQKPTAAERTGMMRYLTEERRNWLACLAHNNPEGAEAHISQINAVLDAGLDMGVFKVSDER